MDRLVVMLGRIKGKVGAESPVAVEPAPAPPKPKPQPQPAEDSAWKF